MAKHNWPAITRDYVEGWQTTDGGRHLPTMDEVASKYRVNPRHLRKHAASNAWTDRRKEFLAKVDQALDRVQARALAVPAAKFNEKMLALADRAADLIAARLVEVSTPGENGKVQSLSFAELGKLALAIWRTQVAGAQALGLEPKLPDLTQDGNLRTRTRSAYEVRIIDKPPPERHADDSYG